MAHIRTWSGTSCMWDKTRALACIFLFLEWLSKRPFGGPSVIEEPTVKRGRRYVEQPRPHPYGQTMAPPLNKSGRTPVGGLLRRGGPSTIVGCVIAVVINPINRVAARLGAHVHKKLGEGLPLGPYPDSSFPVVAVFLAGRILTSVKHAFPRLVLRFVRYGTAAPFMFGAAA